MHSFSQLQRLTRAKVGNAPELVDLALKLSSTADKRIQGLKFVGYCTDILEPTSYLAKLTPANPDAKYLEVSVFIVEDDNNTFNLNRLNFVAGELIVLAENAEQYLGKYVTIGNQYGKSVALRSAFKDTKQGVAVSMNALCFSRDNNSNWVVLPNKLEILEGKLFDKYHHIIRVADDLLDRKGTNGIRRFHGIHPKQRVPQEQSKELFNIDDTVAEELGLATDGAGVEGSEAHGASGASGLISRFTPAPEINGLADIKEELKRLEEARSLFKQRVPLDKVQAKSVRDFYLHTLVSSIAKAMSSNLDSKPQKREYFMRNILGRLWYIEEHINDFINMLYIDEKYLVSQNTIIPSANDLNLIFLSYLEELTGFNFDLRKLSQESTTYIGHYVTKLISNPYLWAMEQGKGTADADAFYFLFKPYTSEGIYGGSGDDMRRYRDMLIVSEILFDTSESNTVYKRSTFNKGVPLPYSQRKGIERFDSPFRVPVNNLIEELTSKINTWSSIKDVYYVAEEGTFNRVCNFRQVTYKSLGIRYSTKAYLLSNPRTIIEDMDENGLLCIISEEDVISTSHLKMELYIYEKARVMAFCTTPVTDSAIKQGIANYEAEKGFKLEPEQVNAVNLLKNLLGCLSGQGGSGKTTISEVIVNIAMHAGYKPVFTAPTAKAARRLEFVVGHLSNVTTMHSKFNLSLGTANVFGSSGDHLVPKDLRTGIEEKVIYVLDEQSMSTLDNLYSVFKCISSSSIVFLLGDIKQLTPIGKGAPFRDQMEYLPAVELGVSKRAKAGSGIANNCDIINNHPNEPLVETDDFVLVACPDDRILRNIRAGIENNIRQGVDPDSIYVITPYSTEKREVSSTNINTYIQDIFLPQGTAPLFTYNEVTYLEGTRVLHSGSNSPDKLKYTFDRTTGTFTSVKTSGVMKGDIGKVRGVVSYTDINLNITQESIEGITPIDSDITPKRGYYVVVEYYDAQLKENLYALYHGKQTSAGYLEVTGHTLFGGELGNIELAYALTVHKFQGSQEKLIIIPITSKDNPNFVNRNLIYTAISRGMWKVVMLGSVKGTASVLERGRKVVATQSILSGILYFTKEWGLEG